MKNFSLWKTLLRSWKTNFRAGEIFANHTSGKEPVSKVYKELSKFNINKQSSEKMGKIHEDIFHQGKYSNKHMKRYSL